LTVQCNYSFSYVEFCFNDVGYAIADLDFGVNDILCNIKLKKLDYYVNNCTVCEYLFSNNIHQFNIHLGI
jgi:hypothetical protein